MKKVELTIGSLIVFVVLTLQSGIWLPLFYGKFGLLESVVIGITLLPILFIYLSLFATIKDEH